MSARIGTVKFTVETGLLMHDVVREITSVAWGLGLDVDVRSVGGWWTKSHRFAIKGSEDSLRRLMVILDRWREVMAA